MSNYPQVFARKCLCAWERAMGLDTADNPTWFLWKQKRPESWFAGLWRAGEKNQKFRSDCRFSATALTQAKESQILTLEMVQGPNLTHTTCTSPGHPTVDGQLTRQEKGTGWGRRGYFLSFKVLIYILTSTLLSVPQIQFTLKS